MSLWQWLLEIIVVILIAAAVYVRNNREILFLSWQLPGSPAWPLFGNAFAFLCKDEDVFERLVSFISAYSSPMRLWFGPKFWMIITDVVQAEKVMSSMKFTTKDKHIYKSMAVFLGEGLISGSGPKWKRDRRLMSPLFLKRNVVQYFPYILHHMKILVKLLEEKVDQPTFNIEHLVHRCATDFVSETMFGLKTNAQGGEMENVLESFKRVYTVVYARVVKVWLQVEWIFRFTKYKKLEEDAKSVVHGFFYQAIEISKGTDVCTSKNDQSFRNVLEQILDIRNGTPDFATDEELVHHLGTLYAAVCSSSLFFEIILIGFYGFQSEDPVTTISSFALVLLGMYPNIQDEVVEEIFSVVGDRDVEEADMANLAYLDMVLNEVLRLFPIAPFIAREASQDFQLHKWTIPKGCTVVVSIHNIHRDGAHWEKPNEFYPEHFLPEAVSKRHPYAFIPFSAGPRGCVGANKRVLVGKPYAYMAIKIILVTVLQRYAIEADGKLKDIPLKSDISVRPKDGIYPIRIKDRVKEMGK
ncbi:hypothetical protein NQ315_008619 [Exocentrus adspersus]|uniref:Cytochrome P450 n=1 Tax=Exocentrus adspersus TaxID=1586481 RepID=A0AAV8W762_9CUCU|nr:hypothetical protein NQ315_008619 [Exocentrus adspersus]